ncbi:MAG: cupin domain-containing protein [Bacteroidota bacterium]
MENLSYIPEKPTRIGDSVIYANESIVSKVLMKNTGGNVTLFAFDKGQQLSEHTAPFDALVLVLDGEGTVTIGGLSHVLKEGDSIVMPANIPHAVNAHERFKMMLVMIREIP